MTAREDGLPEVTGEMLDALEYRYADPPRCAVCEEHLKLMDARGMKYACPSDAASPLAGRHEKAGVTSKEALDHYRNSVRYGPPPGDPAVIALVAEVRRLRAAREAG